MKSGNSRGESTPDVEAEIVVVGAGLIGAAAARHLADRGRAVVLVGPGEPISPGAGDSIVASHYDEARITRTLDPSPVWSEIARRSMEAYPTLERASGIRFHRNDGFLRVETTNLERLERAAAVAEAGGQRTQKLRGTALSALGYAFPPECQGVLESGAAGIVNPRKMLAAQLRLFGSAGGTRCHQTAVRVRGSRQSAVVELDDGARVRAERVLICTGALTNYFDLVRTPVPLEVAVETVWLQEADPVMLASMPGLWYQMRPGAISHVYVLPPVPYADGRHYVKIGGERDPGVPLATLDDVRAFFRSGGTRAVAQALQSILKRIVPAGLLTIGHMKPCMLAYTPSGYPTIDQVDDGIWVAVGGNGSSAKSSNAIGGLAAALVESGSWRDSLSHDPFRLR